MQLTIDKLIYGGDGLARLPADEHGRGKAVFAPFVLPGEVVETALTEEKPGFARARVVNILQSSPQRIQPQCSYFQRCGGCHYQHTSYEHQLELKAAILKENLRRIAKLELATELQVHPSPPWNYRNRTRLKLQTSPEFALGYFKFNSHELLPVEECPISSPLINRAIAAGWQLGRAGKLAEGLQEVEFFANADDTQLLLVAYCTREILNREAEQAAEELKHALPEISGVVMFRGRGADARKATTPSGAKAPVLGELGGTAEAVPFPRTTPGSSSASARGTEDAERIAVVGTVGLTYTTQRASYRVSAGAFFQVNRHLADELVSIVTQGCSGRIALDLYAGVGLFSTVLSREFQQVIAVESSPTSHADLQYNSPANVKAVRAMAEQYLKNVAGRLQPDLVVVDPPRSGLGESVIHALVTLGAPHVTYVSCDPATLSRDLGRLLASGYQVEQAHLVDLFPQTYHLESVFHLVR